MRIKMMTLMAGPGGMYQPGAILELPAAEAKRLVTGGFATAEDPAPKKAEARSTPPAGDEKKEPPGDNKKEASPPDGKTAGEGGEGGEPAGGGGDKTQP